MSSSHSGAPTCSQQATCPVAVPPTCLPSAQGIVKPALQRLRENYSAKARELADQLLSLQVGAGTFVRMYCECRRGARPVGRAAASVLLSMMHAATASGPPTPPPLPLSPQEKHDSVRELLAER